MTVHTKVTRPVLRYHGGKWLLAPWIISHFPPHKIYTEVFGGAASVLMRKKPAYAEVYNDQWDVVVNVFRVLRNPEQAQELQRQLYLTPFSRTEFEATCDENLKLIIDPIEKARMTILRSFAGFGSASTNAKNSTGFRANSNRSGSTPAHDFSNYSRMIPAFVERLKGVIIENRHYEKILHQHDSQHTLHYVDPPYVHSTRNTDRGNAYYAFELTDEDHRSLSEVLKDMKGMVVLSGYESELYNELYEDWRVIKRKTKADGAVDRVECLWLNAAAYRGQSQLLLEF